MFGTALRTYIGCFTLTPNLSLWFGDTSTSVAIPHEQPVGKAEEQSVAYGAAGRTLVEVNVVRRSPVNGSVRLIERDIVPL